MFYHSFGVHSIVHFTRLFGEYPWQCLVITPELFTVFLSRFSREWHSFRHLSKCSTYRRSAAAYFSRLISRCYLTGFFCSLNVVTFVLRGGSKTRRLRVCFAKPLDDDVRLSPKDRRIFDVWRRQSKVGVKNFSPYVLVGDVKLRRIMTERRRRRRNSYEIDMHPTSME